LCEGDAPAALLMSSHLFIRKSQGRVRKNKSLPPIAKATLQIRIVLQSMDFQL
jgi:hypothetical protein